MRRMAALLCRIWCRGGKGLVVKDWAGVVVGLEVMAERVDEPK